MDNKIKASVNGYIDSDGKLTMSSGGEIQGILSLLGAVILNLANRTDYSADQLLNGVGEAMDGLLLNQEDQQEETTNLMA